MNTKYRILLIEDEAPVRASVRSCIDWSKTAFAIVAEATNGEDALELMESSRPDLIITDIVMPQMSGLDFIETIKCNYPDIPCIIISGYDKFDYAQKALSLQVVGYLLKPIDPQELTDLLMLCQEKFGNREKLMLSQMRNHLGNVVAYHSESEQTLYDQLTGNRYLLLISALPWQSAQPPFGWLEETVKDIFQMMRIQATDIVSFETPRFKGIYAILFHSKNLTTTSYHRVATMLSQQIRAGSADCPLPASCCIGAAYPFLSSDSLFSAFQQAIQHLKMRPFLKSDLYTEASQARIVSPKFKDNLTATNEAISFLLQRKKFAEAKAYIGSLLSESNVKEFTPTIANSVISALIGHISLLVALHEFSDLNPEIERLRSQTYLLQFSDISEWCDDILGIIDRIEIRFSEYSHDDVIRQIQKHLASTYSTDWDLVKLANLFYINPSYLCHLFKKKTGTTISAYVENLRIQNACTLLQETAVSVSEIAVLVGYSDPNYFTKRFRKKVGLSPIAYRKQKSITETSEDESNLTAVDCEETSDSE